MSAAEMSTVETNQSHRIAIGILWTLSILGIAFALWRFAFGLRSIANINDAYPWGWWTGFFMTLISFGGVGFTMALLADIFGLRRFEPFVKPAVLVGLLFYSAYTVILVIELGRPWMFWMVFLTWQPTSPLFEIAWCAALYTTCLIIELGKVVAARFKWNEVLRIIKIIYIPVVVLGVTLSHLHQSTLGTLLNILPLKIDPRWWSTLLPATFLATAYMAGLAIITIEQVLATHFLRLQTRIEALGDLAKIQAGIIGLYLILRFSDVLSRGIVPSMFTFSSLTVSLWLELIVGAIIPFVMLLMPEVRRNKWALLTAASLVAGGVLLNRMNIAVFAMEVKHWQTYTPAFGEIITSIGAVAGSILIYIQAIRLLPIHTEPPIEEAGCETSSQVAHS
jgi:Ni/Fe-hydrogenase subunit HybB-like protein